MKVIKKRGVHVHLGSVAGVAVQNHVESLVIEGGRFIF